MNRKEKRDMTFYVFWILYLVFILFIAAAIFVLFSVDSSNNSSINTELSIEVYEMSVSTDFDGSNVYIAETVNDIFPTWREYQRLSITKR